MIGLGVDFVPPSVLDFIGRSQSGAELGWRAPPTVGGPTVPNTQRPTTRVLTCGACRRVEACSQVELLRFTQQGWPTCCGEVMTFVTDPPGADETMPELPRLPPARC